MNSKSVVGPLSGSAIAPPDSADNRLYDMDQRHEPRFATDETVTIKIVDEEEVFHSARVKDISARGLGLTTSVAIPAGTAISIKRNNALILGEVVYCRPAEGSYFLGVELQQILSDLADLRQNWLEWGRRS